MNKQIEQQAENWRTIAEAIQIGVEKLKPANYFGSTSSWILDERSPYQARHIYVDVHSLLDHDRTAILADGTEKVIFRDDKINAEKHGDRVYIWKGIHSEW